VCLTNIIFLICNILPKTQLKPVNSTSVFLLEMSSDSQIRKHKSILTVFGSSDERILLTMQPADLNNHSHETADFRNFVIDWSKCGN